MYLGEAGPDEEYRQNAVVHWFHGQRLLDPAVDGVGVSGGGGGGGVGDGDGGGGVGGGTARGKKKSRLSMGSEVKSELHGWLRLDGVTPYDSGNYTCVPSYAIPAWTEVHVLHGEAESDKKKASKRSFFSSSICLIFNRGEPGRSS